MLLLLIIHSLPHLLYCCLPRIGCVCESDDDSEPRCVSAAASIASASIILGLHLQLNTFKGCNYQVNLIVCNYD